MTAIEADEDAVVFMATTDNKTPRNNIWIGDTGASCHMTNSLDGMSKLRPSNTTITIGDGKSISSTQMGTWQGYVLRSNGTHHKITLQDVAYVPSLSSNLFSITKALSGKATLSSNGERIEVKKNNWKLAFDLKVKTKNGYVPGVQITPINKLDEAGNRITPTTIPYSKAHNLLGHMSEQSTRLTAKHLGLTITRGTSQTCVDCCISKARQKNLNKHTSESVLEPGDLFSSDISSSQSKAYGGAKYWLLVVDHATNMKWTFLLKTRAQQTEVLVNFAKDLKNTHGIQIKRWRTDNAGENKTTFEAFIKNELGIIPEYTTRETPQHTGKVERSFATLYGRVRSMLNHAGFEPTRRAALWAEAAATATKLDNISIHTDADKTPHELFYGTPTKYQDHLRVCGEMGVITKSNTSSIKNKLHDRGLIGVFLGYVRNHAGDAYRMLNPSTNKVWITAMSLGSINNTTNTITLRTGSSF